MIILKCPSCCNALLDASVGVWGRTHNNSSPFICVSIFFRAFLSEKWSLEKEREREKWSNIKISKYRSVIFLGHF